MIKTWRRNRLMRKQRADRFFNDRDLWNLDIAICQAVANGLVMLADREHGYPMGSTAEAWDAELRNNADLLYAWANHFDDYVDGPTEDAEYAGAQSALRWVADNLGSLWD